VREDIGRNIVPEDASTLVRVINGTTAAGSSAPVRSGL